MNKNKDTRTFRIICNSQIWYQLYFLCILYTYNFYAIAFIYVFITKINLTSVKIFTPWQFSLRCYLTFGRCTCLVYLIYTNCVLTKHLDMKRTFLRIIRYCKREGSARVLIPTRQHICIDDRNDKYLLPS